MKNLPTLRNDSSFAVQFRISVTKTRAILLFKIKIKLIEMIELHERMPGMGSAEYQAETPNTYGGQTCSSALRNFIEFADLGALGLI